MTNVISAVVSPRSIGASLFEAETLGEDNVTDYTSSASDVAEVKRALERAGFTITSESEATLSIEGERELFETFFGKKLADKEVETLDGESISFVGTEDDEPLQPNGSLADLVDGVALVEPPDFFAAAYLAPITPVAKGTYEYLSVPDGVQTVLRAGRVHRMGTTGRGIGVAMPDTGFERHPFFDHRGFRADATRLSAGATDPGTDANGHGTGEAANVFAAAPDARLVPIKTADPVDAIKKARQIDGVRVITNSWGYDIDQGGATFANLSPYLKALAVEIQLAINAGIVVLFSAGNGHHAFPACMRDVIAVGGVHVDYPSLDFEASSYASSFVSQIYPGRRVPDVCGLTGKRVTIDGGGFAPSIMLPVPAGSSLDSVKPPTGAANDGWGLFSGTSAACPQVAGVVALMLERDPSLTPKQVKKILIDSARDVTQGQSAMGHAAGTGTDLATGAGLVDAKWAYIQTLGNSPAVAALLAPNGDGPDDPNGPNGHGPNGNGGGGAAGLPAFDDLVMVLRSQR